MAEDSATATLKQRPVNEEMSFGSPANGILNKLIQEGCNDLKKMMNKDQKYEKMGKKGADR